LAPSLRADVDWYCSLCAGGIILTVGEGAKNRWL